MFFAAGLYYLRSLSLAMQIHAMVSVAMLRDHQRASIQGFVISNVPHEASEG